jgi:hypothetical protein
VRASEKLYAKRVQLARLEPGGAPQRPLAVGSASVVEPRALSERCLRCDEPLALREHVAEKHGQRRLRVARLACARCGTPRSLYFELASDLN